LLHRSIAPDGIVVNQSLADEGWVEQLQIITGNGMIYPVRDASYMKFKEI
jgi:hypothetical protein